MKKTLFFLFGLLIIFSSCQNDSISFGEDDTVEFSKKNMKLKQLKQLHFDLIDEIMLIQGDIEAAFANEESSVNTAQSNFTDGLLDYSSTYPNENIAGILSESGNEYLLENYIPNNEGTNSSSSTPCTQQYQDTMTAATTLYVVGLVVSGGSSALVGGAIYAGASVGASIAWCNCMSDLYSYNC